VRPVNHAVRCHLHPDQNAGPAPLPRFRASSGAEEPDDGLPSSIRVVRGRRGRGLGHSIIAGSPEADGFGPVGRRDRRLLPRLTVSSNYRTGCRRRGEMPSGMRIGKREQRPGADREVGPDARAGTTLRKLRMSQPDHTAVSSPPRTRLWRKCRLYSQTVLTVGAVIPGWPAGRGPESMNISRCLALGPVFLVSGLAG